MRKDPRRSREYQALARAVRIESRYACENCGKYAREVDHIVPLHAGGSLMNRENLQLLCRRCHLTKTELERPERIPGRREWRERLYEGL